MVYKNPNTMWQQVPWNKKQEIAGEDRAMSEEDDSA